MSINVDHPIVLGLAGEAGTGKTSTANVLCPQVRTMGDTGRPLLDPDKLVWGNVPTFYWEHLWFAIPLYQIVSARQSITGSMAFDRICYQVHDVLLEIWGRSPLWGAPPYDELYEMVYEIASLPCQSEGKPREFMQKVGTDIVRAYDTDAWVKWMDRRVKQDFQHFLTEYEGGDEEDQMTYAVVISDVRFPNEVDWINRQPNGIVVKFTADPEVIKDRLYERDGFTITAEQSNHASERALDTIGDGNFDAIMDTSDMSVREQAQATVQLVYDRMLGRVSA